MESIVLVIKLTSDKVDLKHEESLVEYSCMKLANACGLEIPEFELFDADNGRYLLKQEHFG